MKRRVNKYDLEFDRTIPYFIKHIQCGKTLSQKIVKKINFDQGSFYTLLPSDAKIERLYEFPYGGINPKIPYGTRTYKIEGVTDNFHPQQIITMDRACSEFISAFTNEQGKNCAIIENYMLEPNDPHAQIENIRMASYEKEVYYFLYKNNSIEEIYKTIRQSSEVWHSLFVLTQIEMTENLDQKIFDLICANAKFIIAGAYDGEGYIFWEKRD